MEASILFYKRLEFIHRLECEWVAFKKRYCAQREDVLLWKQNVVLLILIFTQLL